MLKSQTQLTMQWHLCHEQWDHWMRDSSNTRLCSA